MNPTAVAAVRLIALTGCRRSEVVGLQWADVDNAGQALRLTDSKEGASVRPIGRSALAVLADAGLKGFTPHTLRHSFASVAGDLGYSESTIAAMLGHAAGSVTGRYTHHLDVVLIAAADKVAAAIAGYLDGGT